jgi:hypothetical protein
MGDACRILLEIGVWKASVNYAHRTDEAIAFANDSLKEARLGGVIRQSDSDFSYDVIDVWLGIDEEVRTPKFRGNIFARYELFSAANKKDEQLHGLPLELHPAAIAAKFIAPQVQFDFGGPS